MPNGYEIDFDELVVKVIKEIKKFSKKHKMNPLIVAQNIIKEVLLNLEWLKKGKIKLFEINFTQLFFDNNKYYKVKRQIVLSDIGKAFIATEILDAEGISYEIKQIKNLNTRQIISRLIGRPIVLEKKKISVEDAFEFSYHPTKSWTYQKNKNK